MQHTCQHTAARGAVADCHGAGERGDGDPDNPRGSCLLIALLTAPVLATCVIRFPSDDTSSRDRTLTGAIGPALEGAGYRVLTATPLVALGMAHEVQPDVVVLDATGPGHARAAGALARRLRGLGPTALIPLVALAAQGRPTAALPVNEVVPPPGAGGEVAARVARWLPAA